MTRARPHAVGECQCLACIHPPTVSCSPNAKRSECKRCIAHVHACVEGTCLAIKCHRRLQDVALATARKLLR
eukprot:2335212-Pleurochrysis_carterae.AAC.3